MKKITAFFLAAVMALSMAACGANGDQGVREAVTEDAGGTGGSGGTREASGGGGEAEPAAAVTDRPQPIVVYSYDSEYLDEAGGDYTLLASYRASGVVLSEDSAERYPELASTLNDAWKAEHKACADWLSENKAYAREQMEGDFFFGEYENESYSYISRCDDKVLSIRSTWYEFAGGAHGMYGTGGNVFDVATGKKLSLTDVVTDLEAIKGTVKEKITEGYPDLLEEMESFNSWETVDSMFVENPEYEPVWELTSTGMEFYFNPYTLASYAAGAQQVTVPYSEISGIFKSEYLPNEQFAYISSLSWGEEAVNLIDVNRDGAQEALQVRADYDTDNESYSDVILEVDGNMRRLSALEEMFDLDVRLVTFPSKTMLVIVEGHTYNDYVVRTICDITDGNIKECETNNYTMQGMTIDSDTNSYGDYVAVDPNCLPMAKRMDLLSTYSGAKTYVLHEDGTMSSDDEYFMIPNGDAFFTLKVLQDFTADIIEEDGTVVEKDATISKGSELSLYRTDGKEEEGETAIVDAKTKDGKIVRMKVKAGYPHMVDGIEEFELFDNLMYAG